MKLKEVAEKLNCTVIWGQEGLEQDCAGGYVSDLLSDVAGHAQEGQIWLTIQTHVNVVAVALLRNLAAILFTAGAIPGRETIKKAKEEGIVLLGTDLPTFEAGGRLYLLLRE
ncbi:MAG TPA: serine kinase [Bacillota bacterium]